MSKQSLTEYKFPAEYSDILGKNQHLKEKTSQYEGQVIRQLMQPLLESKSRWNGNLLHHEAHKTIGEALSNKNLCAETFLYEIFISLTTLELTETNKDATDESPLNSPGCLTERLFFIGLMSGQREAIKSKNPTVFSEHMFNSALNRHVKTMLSSFDDQEHRNKFARAYFGKNDAASIEARNEYKEAFTAKMPMKTLQEVFSAPHLFSKSQSRKNSSNDSRADTPTSGL